MGGGGDMSMVFPVNCVFSFFKHLINAFVVHIFRASYVHLITDTDSMQGYAAQIFKVETLLDNAFNFAYTCLSYHLFSC